MQKPYLYSDIDLNDDDIIIKIHQFNACLNSPLIIKSSQTKATGTEPPLRQDKGTQVDIKPLPHKSKVKGNKRQVKQKPSPTRVVQKKGKSRKRNRKFTPPRVCCGVSYSYSSNLSRHNRVEHRKLTNTCAICDKVYRRRDYLKSHIEQKHTE